MSVLIEYLKNVGSLAGLAALVWRMFDEFGTYLRIAVAVTCEDSHVKATTTVDNKGNRAKTVRNALLVVGPEGESPIATANALLAAMGRPQNIEFTNDFVRLKLNNPFYDAQRAIIPVPFYYDENVDIADETLSYAAPIDTALFKVGAAYAVRFFLFPKYGLHRSTEDTFFCPSPAVSV
jgi:hypothetical protein